MFFLQMSGFPGAGKSTVSKYIAKLTGAVIVDHDIVKSVLLKSLAVKGIESTTVCGVSYDIEWALIDSYLEQGHSVILDSPCLYDGMVGKVILIESIVSSSDFIFAFGNNM
ncbi:AAA domain protein [Bacillus clarus]|uniref:AAA domain protein n=1 Tax=Bacillus clarus TaxID=2338372 RepID=A0A090ZCP4_9BACI|nr:AAA domain protein [Bacillus clarus]